jgi:myo-inositol 2-dehydrogenase/D-chiro-inositol 1-dehydrogenase
MGFPVKTDCFFLERYFQSYVPEWEHFGQVLRGEGRPQPSGEDGRRPLLLAEAAYTSLQTGRKVKLSGHTN